MYRYCDWQSPTCRTAHAAREHAATHYLAAGAADDDNAELLAAMGRHPAGGAR